MNSVAQGFGLRVYDEKTSPAVRAHYEKMRRFQTLKHVRKLRKKVPGST